MKDTAIHDERIANLRIDTIYPLYVTKILKKGRTEEELVEVIQWLTGFDKKTLVEKIEKKENFKDFFENAHINPNSNLIKGIICGYRVEEIQNPLTQKIRYLDKLVDELAKGKSIEKILRK